MSGEHFKTHRISNLVEIEAELRRLKHWLAELERGSASVEAVTLSIRIRITQLEKRLPPAKPGG